MCRRGRRGEGRQGKERRGETGKGEERGSRERREEAGRGHQRGERRRGGEGRGPPLPPDVPSRPAKSSMVRKGRTARQGTAAPPSLAYKEETTRSEDEE